MQLKDASFGDQFEYHISKYGDVSLTPTNMTGLLTVLFVGKREEDVLIGWKDNVKGLQCWDIFRGMVSQSQIVSGSKKDIEDKIFDAGYKYCWWIGKNISIVRYVGNIENKLIISDNIPFVICNVCKFKNDYGAPNQQNGSYLCYQCRS